MNFAGFHDSASLSRCLHNALKWIADCIRARKLKPSADRSPEANAASDSAIKKPPSGILGDPRTGKHPHRTQETCLSLVCEKPSGSRISWTRKLFSKIVNIPCSKLQSLVTSLHPSVVVQPFSVRWRAASGAARRQGDTGSPSSSCTSWADASEQRWRNTGSASLPTPPNKLPGIPAQLLRARGLPD